MTEEEIKNSALMEIEKNLHRYGETLKDVDSMPYPKQNSSKNFSNQFIVDEMQYNFKQLAEDLNEMMPKLTDEQRNVFDSFIDSVDNNRGFFLCVYGYGGTGKTFVWKVLSTALRSKRELVLNVASSGIASLLLPGGRTTHSRFKIPLTPDETSTCNIRLGTDLDELIQQTKLIIWDEAPMMHKYCFEALDRTLKDIMKVIDPKNIGNPFGGKTMVFGGDFRQILPVIPKGRRHDIVSSTINASYIWSNCQVLHLTKNMRLQNTLSGDEQMTLSDFSKWIANIGDRTIGVDEDGTSIIDIPEHMLINNTEDPIESIVQAIYSNLNEHLDDPKYLQERATLAPTVDVVHAINEHMINKMSGECRSYYSSNTASSSDTNSEMLADLQTPEFLNTIKCSGVPNHELHLKIGTPVMILRNLDPGFGLCNDTRLTVTNLGSHVIEGKILNGTNMGEKVLIPRISLTPSDIRVPFKFERRQFPIMISYAMTINKSQGQSLSKVGIFLKKPVFSHGQLYVVVSRVINPTGLKILLCDNDENNLGKTVNVVYKEIFRNL